MTMRRLLPQQVSPAAMYDLPSERTTPPPTPVTFEDGKLPVATRSFVKAGCSAVNPQATEFIPKSHPRLKATPTRSTLTTCFIMSNYLLHVGLVPTRSGPVTVLDVYFSQNTPVETSIWVLASELKQRNAHTGLRQRQGVVLKHFFQYCSGSIY